MLSFNIKLFIVILLAGITIQIGIWNASVPMGDEAGYISDAMKMTTEGVLSPNAYNMFYVFLLKNINSDPIHVHLICRFVSSICSIALVYLMLSSIPLIADNQYAILVTSAFWAACRLNVPEVQFGNINLFTLNIILPSIILLMRKLSINRLLFLLISLLWASQIRMEYYAPFVLTIIYTVIYILLKLRKNSIFPAIRQRSMSAILLIITGIFSFSLIKMSQHKSFADMDRHLLLGLEQCYASLYSKLNPGKKISTMVEYSSVTDEVFNEPTGFFDACMKNPKEVAKYLALNGAINSALLVPAILRHRSLLIPDRFGKKGEAIQLIILMSVISLGLYFRFERGKYRFSLQKLFRDYRFIILSIICTGALVSILLHIPDARYWITCIPLTLTVIAFSVGAIFDKISSERKKIMISLALVAIFMHPLFIYHKSNQSIIKRMREWSHSGDKPIIAGLYPHALGTYSFGLDNSIVTVNDFKLSEITSQKYDFISIDSYFRSSAYYASNSKILSDFERTPQNYGYQNIGTTSDKYEMSVYAKISSTSTINSQNQN